ncbi:MAG: ABC transporter ATP-binding protein [Fusobacteriaceae bacterium]
MKTKEINKTKKIKEKLKRKNKSSWSEILKYLILYKNEFIFILILTILGNGLIILGPYLIGKAINLIKINISMNDKISFIKIIFMLFSSYFIGTIVNIKKSLKLITISENIVYTMRNNIIKKLHDYPLKFYDKTSHGSILSTAITDTDNISSSLVSVINEGIVSVVTVVTIFIVMMSMSPELAFIQVGIFGTALFFLKKIMIKSKERMRMKQSYLGKLCGHVEESLMGSVEIKSFNKEENIIEEFEKLNNIYKENSISAYYFGGLNFPTLNFLGNIGYSVIVLVGGIYLSQGEMTLGELSSFIIYCKIFNRRIGNLGDILSTFQSIMVSSERVFSLVNKGVEKESGANKIDAENTKGKIEFKNVNFSYANDKLVLKNLNLIIEPGKTVALVGPSGSGKTTLVNLLMGFYKINSGEILIDNINIVNYKKSEIGKIIGMVLQDTWIFSGTIRENISYGNENITLEKIKEVCKIACIHEFIMKQPKEYETLISEENNSFSQGQIQLLTIARCLAYNLKILILDEATSGVDTRTELLFQKAMKKIMSGRTCFVIAHRLSTIKDADIILVIKDGEIIESGNSEELLKKNGYYKKLYSKSIEIIK